MKAIDDRFFIILSKLIIMNKKLMTLLLLLIFLPNLVFAQSTLSINLHELLNIPEEYTKMPELLYFVFIPFISVFAIIFGLLSQLFGRIFSKKICIILAFVFAFSLLYLGPLMALVGVLFQIGSIFGVIVFFIMFVVLTLLLMYHRVGESAVEARKVYQQYKDISKQTERLGKDLEKIGKDLKEIEENINKKKADLSGVQECFNRVHGMPFLPGPVWDTIKWETKRLTGTTPANTIMAEGLLATRRSQLNVEIAKLDKKRATLEKNKKYIEDKLRA